MQNNSNNDIIETLIRYMDGELNGTEYDETEKLLQNDAALQEHYQHLLAAKKAIRALGVKQRVQAVQQEYLQQAKPESAPAPKVARNSSFFKNFMRIAAILIVVIAGYGVLQYSTTTSQSVYNDAYITYQLPVNRGEENKNQLAEFYKANNYKAVISSFNKIEPKNQEAYFLLGQSYLQTNNADEAINAFKQVEKLNENSDEKYFLQETDYYLMLAYIKNSKIELAQQKLDEILAQPQHLFYNKAKQISRTKMTMLKLKEK